MNDEVLLVVRFAQGSQTEEEAAAFLACAAALKARMAVAAEDEEAEVEADMVGYALGSMARFLEVGR